jgi:sulfite reductase (NADPH) flavoprotein alpha-component
MDFMAWVYRLNKVFDVSISIEEHLLEPKERKKVSRIQIIEKKQEGDVFLLHCKSQYLTSMKSGDLLGVYPPYENRERFYSIAVLSKTEFLLVIKRVGLCSTYLTYLQERDFFEGYLKINAHFHLPVTHKPTILIANGTGIAPFLGMQSGKSQLLWGGRKASDFSLFEPYCMKYTRHLAFSREENASYVQDLVQDYCHDILQSMDEGGVMYICGSLGMLQEVTQVFQKVLSTENRPTFQALVRKGQIRIDCY